MYSSWTVAGMEGSTASLLAGVCPDKGEAFVCALPCEQGYALG